MPNSIAYLALLLWPVVMVVMFRRLSLERALVWSILGAYLFLPPAPFTALKVPGLPALDKMSLPAVVGYVIIVFMLKRKVPLMPKGVIGRFLLLLFMLAPFGTILTNPEIIPVATRPSLPALRLYDAFSIIAYQGFVVLTFALSRSVLATTEGLREILWAFLIGGLIYSIPMLLEIRLSPQLNVWIYGFFQHSFDQMMRQGGFRPIVFLAHGLWVAFFCMTAVIAAAALAREKTGPEKTRLTYAMLYLLVILVLCKSAASVIYAVALLPLVLWTSQKLMIRLAVIMAILALAYPVLRANGYIPADEMVRFAASYSPDRAQSLEYRFDNEALLVEHAYRKPWFGWGGYERSLLQDAITGRTYTVPDGRWVIVFGMYGWSGYIAEFGLFTLPLLLLWWEARRNPDALEVGPIGALALMHGVNMIDMLPNATATPLTWMIAGALLGHAELMPAGSRSQTTIAVGPAPPLERRTLL